MKCYKDQSSVELLTRYIYTRIYHKRIGIVGESMGAWSMRHELNIRYLRPIAKTLMKVPICKDQCSLLAYRLTAICYP